MKGHEIVQRVWETLEREGLKKIAARRKVVDELRSQRSAWTGVSQALRAHDTAVLTIDQSLMSTAGKGLRAKVLVLGNHVGNVEFDDQQRNPVFVVTRKNLTPSIAVPTSKLRWSKDSKHGAEILKFLRACEEGLPAGSSELQVQLALVKRLKGSKTADPALKALQPVMPFGLPTEVATVVNLSGNAATGNMDILARTSGKGSPRDGGDFVVLELKCPTLSAREVTKAFQQAIQYAAALTIEANALLGTPHTDPAIAYRQLFSNERKSRSDKYSGLPLVAHAVVVLPHELEAAARKTMDSLALDEPLVVKSGTAPMGVGVLLYKAEATTVPQRTRGRTPSVAPATKWILPKRPDTFRWLDHPHAWVPGRKQLDT